MIRTMAGAILVVFLMWLASFAEARVFQMAAVGVFGMFWLWLRARVNGIEDRLVALEGPRSEAERQQRLLEREMEQDRYVSDVMRRAEPK